VARVVSRLLRRRQRRSFSGTFICFVDLLTFICSLIILHVFRLILSLDMSDPDMSGCLVNSPAVVENAPEYDDST
jgi:hypothetical protein